ncbi:SAV_915 family protein [Streptosporangium sp. NPDC051022]|uniref:SAV_915 family protein n=1 Tax=Streptosporangium sp. NPDC051022 TaxID=3155752 RepID=UPI003432EB55
MEISPRNRPPLLVPVRAERGVLSLRLFRTQGGGRTAIAFTSRDRLVKVLGEGHAWMWLNERALREMVGNLDAVGVLIDPAGAGELQNPGVRAA